MKHAIVPVGEYLVPLVGVPKDAALEQCDCCGDIFPLWKGRPEITLR